MQRKLNVLFVCNEYPPASHGGIGTFVQLIGRSLSGAGCQVIVAGLRGNGCPAGAYENDHGVLVYRLQRPLRDPLGVRSRVMLYRRVKELVQAHRIDLVEVPDAEGWAAGWPAVSVPVITRVHGSSSYFAAETAAPRTLTRRLTYLIERASIRRSDYWCAVSRYAAEKTQKLFTLPPADTVAYNPVVISSFVELKDRSTSKVVFTGTLAAKKGIRSLIDAWPSVVSRRQDAELHLYGRDGRTEGQRTSEFLAARLPEEARRSVFFHGPVPREVVMEILKSARVAVFPSRAEAFAFAPLEAMGCGCPTIYSTRCSGPELIDHESNGLLIDPDDSNAISAAILRTLNDDALAQRLGAAGAAKVRSRFTTQSMIPELLAFYERCAVDFASRHGILVGPRAAAGVGA